MLKVKVKNKNIDQALKIFKNKVYKTHLLLEVRDRQEHTKKSAKRRKQKKHAIYVNKKYSDND